MCHFLSYDLCNESTANRLSIGLDKCKKRVLISCLITPVPQQSTCLLKLQPVVQLLILRRLIEKVEKPRQLVHGIKPPRDNKEEHTLENINNVLNISTAYRLFISHLLKLTI